MSKVHRSGGRRARALLLDWGGGTQPCPHRDRGAVVIEQHEDVEGTTYVQLAGRAVFDGTSLTLLELAPATVCQSSLPAGGLGYLPTGLFLDRWYAAVGGFGTRAVPAVLSLLDPDSGQAHDARLSLALPRIRGTGLEYQVRVVVGDLPATAGACVLFISPQGRPVTPPHRVPAVRGMPAPSPAARSLPG